MMNMKILMNPEEHGYEVCSHCNGYGSSFQDTGDTRCTKCGGHGLTKKEDTT